MPKCSVSEKYLNHWQWFFLDYHIDLATSDFILCLWFIRKRNSKVEYWGISTFFDFSSLEFTIQTLFVWTALCETPNQTILSIIDRVPAWLAAVGEKGDIFYIDYEKSPSEHTSKLLPVGKIRLSTSSCGQSAQPRSLMVHPSSRLEIIAVTLQFES